MTDEPPTIRTIIFDLGKVLVPFDFNRAYERLEARYGITVAEIRRRLPVGLYVKFESGLIGPHDFVSEMARTLDIEITYEDFCAIWTSIFLPETLVSDEFIAALAGRYRLLLLSNTNIIHFEMIRATYPLIRHFHALVLSYELMVMKPSAGIYQAAIAAGFCKPEECFFIDDIFENVEGARAEGMEAIQFFSAQQMQGEMRERGLI